MKVSKQRDPLKPKFRKVEIDQSRRCIHVFTDGACQGNGQARNLGGYAFIAVEDNELVTEYHRGISNTTNNKCELQGIIAALTWLNAIYPSNMQIIIYSDSQYCVHGINAWSEAWIAKNWVGVKNAELWQELIKLKSNFTYLQVKWTRAHQIGDSFEIRWNNYVDKLAVEAYSGKREEDRFASKVALQKIDAQIEKWKAQGLTQPPMEAWGPIVQEKSNIQSSELTDSVGRADKLLKQVYQSFIDNRTSVQLMADVEVYLQTKNLI